MQAELAKLQSEARFELDVVDVDADPALEAKYGNEVPVLLAGARELCRNRLDAAQVTAYLLGRGNDEADRARKGQIG